MALKYFLFALIVFSFSEVVLGSLSPDYYINSCPDFPWIVYNAVQQVVQSNPRMCASLIRLFFHDCHVNGCDASIMLAGSSLEQNAIPNINSLQGYDVINNIKAQIEANCSGVVSCADIIAITAQMCVTALGGPFWFVNLGRRDGLTASQSAANTNLPSPFFNVSTLISNFQTHGLSLQDMVALSGAHTVGKAHCSSFKPRLYGPFPTPDAMDTSFNASLRSQCPNVNTSNMNLVDLDLVTNVTFDNMYFVNLCNYKGLLFTDETLYVGGSSAVNALVAIYAANQTRFFQDFVTGMINMGNEIPILAPSGQVRLNCSRVN